MKSQERRAAKKNFDYQKKQLWRKNVCHVDTTASEKQLKLYQEKDNFIFRPFLYLSSTLWKYFSLILFCIYHHNLSKYL